MTLDPLIRSWQFAWLAEGRSQRTLREMTPFLVKFREKCPALPAATRSDCEEFRPRLLARPRLAAASAARIRQVTVGSPRRPQRLVSRSSVR